MIVRSTDDALAGRSSFLEVFRCGGGHLGIAGANITSVGILLKAILTIHGAHVWRALVALARLTSVRIALEAVFAFRLHLTGHQRTGHFSLL